MTDELLEQFLIEGRDQQREAEQSLARLAAEPQDASALEVCFRAIHTLKGSAGLFDMAPLSQLLHAMEDRLDQARAQGRLAPNEAQLLVRAADLVADWFDALDDTGALPEDAGEAARRLLGATPMVDAASGADQVSPGGLVRIRYRPRPDAYFVGDDPLAIIASTPKLISLDISPGAGLAPSPHDPFGCRLVIDAVCEADLKTVKQALMLVADQVELTVEAKASAPAHRPRAVRVAIERLDELARLSQEATLGRNGLDDLVRQVGALPGGLELSRRLAARLAHLARLSDETRGAIAKARLVPLSGLYERLPRLVRSLSETLAKPAELQLSGGALEMDRGAVEGLYEPMLHVLRNAMDHGLEAPSVRAAAAKPAVGQITIRAQAKSGQVVIEIADDGAGVDVAAVRRRAAEQGVLEASAVAALDDDAARQLIFHPGFSTAAAAGEVSGRGVGMDAVRAAVGRLGGRVQVKSRSGRGTTVSFIMPASIMLTPLVVVEAAGVVQAAPFAGVMRVSRLAAEDAAMTVATIDGNATKLVRLADLVGEPSSGLEGRALLLRDNLALVVDKIHGRLDAVVSPLTGLLAGAPLYAGSAIGSDGAPLLVLDLEAVG